MKPMRPVPRGCEAGAFHGRYKVEPDDFVVDEVPAYEPVGDGTHVWLWLEKRGLSTLDVIDDLARKLQRHARSFGVAGLKDARSISRQWLSIEHVDERAVTGLVGGDGDSGYRVLRVSRHHNKLRLGHLRGNRFTIVLRGTGPDDAATARQNLAELARLGVPNYFGEQRFGKRGANLQKGLELLRGRGMQQAARRMPRRVFGLVLSAVQSEVFNRVVHKRLATLGAVQPGDLLQLHRNGAVFQSEQVDVEQTRADALELSPTGPMPGPEMMRPSGDVLELERRALEELELNEAAFSDLPFGLSRGERRALRMPLHNPEVRAVDAGVELRFTLPRGGYATSVLRELLVDTIWFGGADAPGGRRPFRRRR